MEAGHEGGGWRGGEGETGRGRQGGGDGEGDDGEGEMRIGATGGEGKEEGKHIECLGGMRVQFFLTLCTCATPGTPASLY